jgi:hypothetical protein
VTGIGGHWRSGLLAAIVAATVILAAVGCTPDLVHLEPTRRAAVSPSSAAPTCTGKSAEPLLAGLLADLASGMSNLVPRYIAPANAFVRWTDPKSGDIGRSLGDGTAALDQLKEHLFGLEVDGVVLSMTSFHDEGSSSDGLPPDDGGWFSFTVTGVPATGAAVGSGYGSGAIDCESGRIKILTIAQW